MKGWLIALLLFVPLALSAGPVDETAADSYEVKYADETADPVLPTEPINVPMWLAILVGCAGVVIMQVRMNETVSQLNQKIDKLERYVNSRDNLLAVRIDELDEAVAGNADSERRPRNSRDISDDWKPQRRH